MFPTPYTCSHHHDPRHGKRGWRGIGENGKYPHWPLVVKHPSGSGRRVETYSHLLGGALVEGSPITQAATIIVELEAEQVWRSRMEQQIQDLQTNVEELSAMVQRLRSELGEA